MAIGNAVKSGLNETLQTFCEKILPVMQTLVKAC